MDIYPSHGALISHYKLVGDKSDLLTTISKLFTEQNLKYDGTTNIKSLLEGLDSFLSAPLTSENIEFYQSLLVTFVPLLNNENDDQAVIQFCDIVTRNLDQKIQEVPKYKIICFKTLLCLFLTLDLKRRVNYEIYLKILKIINSNAELAYIQTDFPKYKSWFTGWKLKYEERKTFVYTLMDTLNRLGQNQRALHIMVEFLRANYSKDKIDVYCKDLKRLLSLHIASPTIYLLDHLTLLPAINTLHNEPIYKLLNIFIHGKYRDYIAWYNKYHESTLEELGLNHEDNCRKIRILTFIQLASDAYNANLNKSGQNITATTTKNSISTHNQSSFTQAGHSIPFQTITHELDIPLDECEEYIIDAIRTKLVRCRIDGAMQCVGPPEFAADRSSIFSNSTNSNSSNNLNNNSATNNNINSNWSTLSQSLETWIKVFGNVGKAYHDLVENMELQPSFNIGIDGSTSTATGVSSASVAMTTAAMATTPAVLTSTSGVTVATGREEQTHMTASRIGGAPSPDPYYKMIGPPPPPPSHQLHPQGPPAYYGDEPIHPPPLMYGTEYPKPQLPVPQPFVDYYSSKSADFQAGARPNIRPYDYPPPLGVPTADRKPDDYYYGNSNGAYYQSSENRRPPPPPYDLRSVPPPAPYEETVGASHHPPPSQFRSLGAVGGGGVPYHPIYGREYEEDVDYTMLVRPTMGGPGERGAIPPHYALPLGGGHHPLHNIPPPQSYDGFRRGSALGAHLYSGGGNTSVAGVDTFLPLNNEHRTNHNNYAKDYSNQTYAAVPYNNYGGGEGIGSGGYHGNVAAPYDRSGPSYPSVGHSRLPLPLPPPLYGAPTQPQMTSSRRKYLE